jgi:DNA (cytosine-5)-methyltransferase 1
MENVSGFASGRTSALEAIASVLSKVNRDEGTSYRLHAEMIDAADLGVPQRRSRAIVVAFRDGRHFEWPVPSHRTRPTRGWDALHDVDEPAKPAASGKWAALLPSIPEGENYLWHTDRGEGRSLFGYRTRFWSFLLKLAKDQPAWTLPAQPGPSAGPFHWENRPLSIKEMLRLQTFPASWKVAGAFRDQVRQVGNATPPLLAEVIGRAIGEQAFGKTYERRPKFGIRRCRYVPAPEPVAAVPQEFLAEEGRHVAHLGTGRGPRPIKMLHAAA